MRELSDVAGVKVIIHDPLRMVFPADEGYFLSPGYLASLALKKVGTDAAELLFLTGKMISIK